MYVFSREIYERAWDLLKDIYDSSHPEVILYLSETWIRSHKSKFVKFYTDKILHFGNNFTSRSEGGHAVLKRSLSFSTGDLKKMINCIELMLMNH